MSEPRDWKCSACGCDRGVEASHMRLWSSERQCGNHGCDCANVGAPGHEPVPAKPPQCRQYKAGYSSVACTLPQGHSGYHAHHGGGLICTWHDSPSPTPQPTMDSPPPCRQYAAGYSSHPCTLPNGHGGTHIARNRDGERTRSWDDPPAVLGRDVAAPPRESIGNGIFASVSNQSALQAIQGRPKVEPWRPSIDEWDLLPDAGR